MAKKRHQPKYSLGETLEDVKINIEGAGVNTTAEIKTEAVIPEPVTVPATDTPSTPVTETEVEEFPVKSPTLSQTNLPVKSIKEKKKPSAKTENGKRANKSEVPIIDDELTDRRNARNVELDDETLWRLDQAKDKLNRVRPEGAPLVSQKSIIRTALIEWLDKYYPGTKEAYHFINNLD